MFLDLRIKKTHCSHICVCYSTAHPSTLQFSSTPVLFKRQHHSSHEAQTKTPTQRLEDSKVQRLKSANQPTMSSSTSSTTNNRRVTILEINGVEAATATGLIAARFASLIQSEHAGVSWKVFVFVLFLVACLFACMFVLFACMFVLFVCLRRALACMFASLNT